MPMAKPTGVWGFKLNLGGPEADGFFKDVTGLQSFTNVATDAYEDEQGKPYEFSIPTSGSTLWSPIMLMRGVDDKTGLWDWRQQVIDGDIDGAKRDVTIELVDNQGTTVKTFSVVGAWPSGSDWGSFSSTGQGIAIESYTLTHEGITLA